MSVSLKLTVKGIERMAERMSRASNFLGKDRMKTLLEGHGASLIREYQRQILSFTPGRVKDLSPRYAERKLDKYGVLYPILYATGGLFNSMVVRVRDPRGGWIRKRRGWTISLSFKGRAENGARYSDIAEGHIEGAGRLPKRDFTKESKSWKRAVLRSIQDGLKRTLKQK